MKKYSTRNLFKKLHLWLGLPSGIVIFIVAITGCIYAFQDEIKDMMRPSLKVESNGKAFLSPEELKEKAGRYVFVTPADSSNAIFGVMYATYDKAATVACSMQPNGYTVLYLNPYNGELLHKEAFKNDFFRVMLAGHRSLWLPHPIGKQIVGWSVVVFVLVLLSGIALWIPAKMNKKALKAGLKIKWKAPFSRVNYDLHNVLGFYTALVALLIALTGLTWSFSWFAKGYYGVITGGKEFRKWEPAQSDTTLVNGRTDASTILWEQMIKEYPVGNRGTFRFDFPQKPQDAFTVCFNPHEHSYYAREFRFFDQHTLKELKAGGTYGIKLAEASAGDKLYRMNYDIHTGSILGLPGRIIVFLASLIIASLPVTGMIIWWRKKKKRRKLHDC